MVDCLSKMFPMLIDAQYREFCRAALVLVGWLTFWKSWLATMQIVWLVSPAIRKWESDCDGRVWSFFPKTNEGILLWLNLYLFKKKYLIQLV
jgi:hypothetical protein